MKLIALLSAAFLAATPAFAAEYSIDPAHSKVGFKIKHLAISNVSGHFGEFEGNIKYEPENLESSSVDASVKVNSIDTEEKKRDDHLRSEDFFETAKYPAMTFKSTKISDVAGDNFKLHGDLTIRGITKPVVLDVTKGGSAKDPWGKERVAFEATTKINRKDFGLKWNKLLETGALVVGEDVSIVLEIEAIKKA